MAKHFKIKIKGRVQGVWFRGSTQRRARELNLCGFVRNEPDGSVYAEAEGEEKNLQELLDWCKNGPELAVVKSVEAEEGPLIYYQSFDILR